MNPFAPLLQPYFRWLNEMLGPLAEEVSLQGVTAGEITRDFLSSPSRRQEFQSESLPTICRLIQSFWQDNRDAIASELLRVKGFKARFGGDLGPQAEDAIFQSTGLYLDTIVVPDPLLRVANMEGYLRKNQDYYFIKYGISLLLFQDVFLAEADPPIAVLLGDPDPRAEDSDRSEIAHLAELDCVMLTNELFKQNFDDYNQVEFFFSRFSRLEEVVGLMENPEALFLDENAPIEPMSQLEAAVSKTRLAWDFGSAPLDLSSPEFLLFLFFSRMLQANRDWRRARMADAHLLVGGPVAFHWLRWKIRANQRVIAKQLGISDELDLYFTNSLLGEKREWLSNVPTADLIEHRKHGRLAELRATIKEETDRLAQMQLDDLELVIEQVDYNLSTALAKHQDDIEHIDAELRTQVAAPVTSYLSPVGASFEPSVFPLTSDWGAVLGQSVLQTESLQGLAKPVAERLRERRMLPRTPIAILWNAKTEERIRS